MQRKGGVEETGSCGSEEEDAEIGDPDPARGYADAKFRGHPHSERLIPAEEIGTNFELKPTVIPFPDVAFLKVPVDEIAIRFVS